MPATPCTRAPRTGSRSRSRADREGRLADRPEARAGWCGLVGASRVVRAVSVRTTRQVRLPAGLPRAVRAGRPCRGRGVADRAGGEGAAALGAAAQPGGVAEELDQGTVAVTTVLPARAVEPVTRPRRAARSPSTPPTASSGTVAVTSTTGSSSTIADARSASRSANRPAVRNAISEESLEWVAPSVSVTRTPVTGCPPIGPSASASRQPSSTARTYSRGTRPPTTVESNANTSAVRSAPAPASVDCAPGRSGSTSMTTWANCPAPPSCLTCR